MNMHMHNHAIININLYNLNGFTAYALSICEGAMEFVIILPKDFDYHNFNFAYVFHSVIFICVFFDCTG